MAVTILVLRPIHSDRDNQGSHSGVRAFWKPDATVLQAPPPRECEQQGAATGKGTAERGAAARGAAERGAAARGAAERGAAARGAAARGAAARGAAAREVPSPPPAVPAKPRQCHPHHPPPSRDCRGARRAE
ncbi:unnamed protein product [Closterium sp. NIES-53]